MTYLVTGGAGFIGSNFTRHLLLSDPEASVIILDSLSYAGRLTNLADVLPPFSVFQPSPHGEAARIEFDDTGSMTVSFPVAETLGRWKGRLEGWSPVCLPRDNLGKDVGEFLRSGRSRIAFVIGSCVDRSITDQLVPLADRVINLAAETHVDRSIRDAERFLIGNVLGVHALLEAARGCPNVEKILHVSTDEV
ncbi:MAG TPA: GDP-mannose 4,6-dehydratase, partial [Candidatus Paceibacterota bacterium]|nr:GDP-mannose 4,6-dehydratase [Candidatus Paceibacterota bacterium]